MGGCCNSAFVDTYEVRRKDSISIPTIDTKKVNLNQLLTLVIKQYSNMTSLLSLKKISLEHIWNILKASSDNNHTSILNDYIILDLRSQRNSSDELFLKRFIQFPFTYEDLQNIQKQQEQSLRRYLENKTLILIVSEDKKNQIEGVVKQMIHNKITMKLYLLNNTLNINTLDLYRKELYKLFDKKYFIELPNIPFSLKYFPNLNNEAMIFYSKVNDMIVDDPEKYKYSGEFVSNKNYWMKADQSIHPIKSFFDSFGIGIILQVTNSLSLDQNNSIQEKIVEYTNHKHLGKVTTYKVTYDDYMSQHLELIKVLNMIKARLQGNNQSLFIQVDETLNYREIINVILITIWKITDFDTFKLLNYAEDHFVFIPKVKELLHEENKDIKELFGLYGYQTEQFQLEEAKFTDMILLEDKLFFLMREMLKELSNKKDKFKETCDIIEKVLDNIIKNPNDEKYYKVKKSSNALKGILSLKSGKTIFNLLGFNPIGVFYVMPKRENVSFIKGQYFDFIKSSKKIMENSN